MCLVTAATCLSFISAHSEIIICAAKLSSAAFTGAHRLRCRDKRVENYPDFEKLVPVIQYGLQGFIITNSEGESTEASNLSLIL